jgi:hypothetical protein
MAELLGLSGVGGTLLPPVPEVSGVGVGGFGRGRDAGFSRGRGRVLSGSGCVRTLYGTSVWVLVVEELWRGWLLARRFTYRG